jgi:hypothetical protein
VVVRIHILHKWNAQTFLRNAKFHKEKEAKWTSKPHKIQSSSATIPHFPAETTFWSNFFHNTGVVRSFSEQNFPWKWKPQNFALTFTLLIFRYEILSAKLSHRPIVLLESGIFFVLVVISVTKYRFTAFSIFWVQNANIGELFPQKNQELEIFNFTKVMAKKWKISAHFLKK